MPTDLEFAYNYNQIDTYVLNGNIHENIECQFWIEIVLSEDPSSCCQNNNKLWPKVVLYESEVKAWSCSLLERSGCALSKQESSLNEIKRRRQLLLISLWYRFAFMNTYESASLSRKKGSPVNLNLLSYSLRYNVSSRLSSIKLFWFSVFLR